MSLSQDFPIQDVSGYSYLDCYSDSESRLLQATSTVPTSNYPQYCCDWCVNVNTSYTFCGVEHGKQCFCDSTTHAARTAPASDCSSTCAGVPGGGTYECGGSWHLNLYSATISATTAAPSESLTPQSVSGYSYVGCYSDATSRILSGHLTHPTLNDPKFCCELCLNINNNYKWCGVEYGSEYRCDSTTSSALLAAESDCNKPCAGGGGYQCGGFYVMNLYKATGFVPNTTMSSAIPSQTSTLSALPQHSGGGLSGGSIAGIAVGAVAVVLFIGASLFLLICRRRSQLSPRYISKRFPEQKAAKVSIQSNVHELQAPFEAPRGELRAVPEQVPTLYEMDASRR